MALHSASLCFGCVSTNRRSSSTSGFAAFRSCTVKASALSSPPLTSLARSRLREFLTKRTSLFAVWVCGNCEGERMAWRGNLSRNLKELRILLCQSSPASSPTRTFIEKNYKDLKTLNPKFPILIRECRGTEPQLWARYDMGVERGVRLEGLTEEQISKTLEELVKVGAALKA